MNNLINAFYKNHHLVYKILLFIITTFLIVYVFPKSGKFKYSFEKGKPWQSENLYAPFDFAIQKEQKELEAESAQIEQTALIYLTLNEDAQRNTLANYDERYNQFVDSLTQIENPSIYEDGKLIIQRLYQRGLLSQSLDYEDDRTIVILEGRNQVARKSFGSLLKQGSFKPFLEEELRKKDLNAYDTNLLGLFFEIIEPNLALDEVLTQKALNEELSALSTVRGNVEKETLIISKGEVVQGEKFAILKSLQSEYENRAWNQTNYYWIVGAYTLLVSLALLMLLLFLKKYRSEVYANNTMVTFIFFNIFVIILFTTLVVKYNAVYVYLVPICILPLILKAFFDARLGLFAHVITVLLLGFIVPNNYEYMFLQIIAGIVTILTVSELYKRANLFISVGQITLIYIVAYFAFFIIHEGTINSLNWETFVLFILCGLATLFVLPLIYMYEKMFGLVSDVSLLELSDTNSKLLKELSNKAPGTFHHSLNVANLAEAAANEIGANAMLVRVGALYHDIGKMKNPTFFTENQSTLINPHNELQPLESAKIIIDHVINGIEIARKYNLPDRIIDFIRTHHGTSLVYYFYKKQQENEVEVDETKFRYLGPKPFSRETAILMMCDSVEAASKSLKEPTTAKINDFVERIIDGQMQQEQFANADITFKEIMTIKKVLKHKLANIYHLRIEYPD
ncbi:MAG: HD family phosphohydrolase [bacterium]